MTSLTLLQEARAGNPHSWARLVGIYSPLVRHWCRRWGLQPADVEDLTQEVFAAVARHLGRFRKEQPADTFRAWLRGITRNKLLEAARRHRDRPTATGGSDAWRLLEEIPVTDPADSPEDADQVSNLFHQVLGLIREEFEPRTWQAFWRVTVDEQAVADVAADLGISPNAVRVARCRVLRRLREELGELNTDAG